LNDKWVDISKFTSGEILVRLQGVFPKVKCSVLQTKDSLFMDDYIQLLGSKFNIKQEYFESESEQMEILNNGSNLYTWETLNKVLKPTLTLFKNEKVDDRYCVLPNQYISLKYDLMFNKSCDKNEMTLLGNPKLIKERNDKWVKKIIDLLDTNSCFISVGLGHLCFDCGLIGQLKNLGYTIEPVSLE